MGKNGWKIEIQKGSNLPNPFVIGRHTLDRGSPVEVDLPSRRAFRSSGDSIDAKVVFYLDFEGFV